MNEENKNLLKNTTMVLASVASIVVIVASTTFIKKEYTFSELDLSCSNNDVLNLFKDVATRDISKQLDKEKLKYTFTIDKSSINTRIRTATGNGKYRYSCNGDIKVKVMDDDKEIINKIVDLNYKTFENDLGDYFWVLVDSITVDDLKE